MRYDQSPGGARKGLLYVSESLEPRLLLQGVQDLPKAPPQTANAGAAPAPAGVIIPADFSPDRFEPNNSRSFARDFGSVGGRSERDLSIHAPLNDDYYRIVTAGAGPLNISVFFNHAQGDVDLELLDAGGNVVATSATTNNVEIILRSVAARDVYYLRVFGYSGAINPNYEMTIAGPGIPADRFEQNDTLAAATNFGSIGDRT